MYRRVFVREMHFLRYVGPANVYKPTSQPSQQVINDKKFDAQSKEVGRIVKPPVPGSTPENQLTYDQVTHTGQAFDNEDVRLGRFHDGFKLVNPNVAMHMIAQVKPIPVHGRIATCDGGGGALGHPKVFINLDKSGNHTCGYCGLRFYKEGLENDGTNHISV